MAPTAKILEDKDGDFIMLEGVRGSFPSLKKRSVYNGEEGKYEATLLIDKTTGAEAAKLIKAAIDALIQDKLKGAKLSADKICMKDGDDGRAEYANTWTLKASSNAPVTVLGAATAQPVDDEGGIYSGCYIKAKIRLWGQNNSYGKRINANLVAVMFEADGEAFSGAHIRPEVAAAGFAPASADEAFTL